MAGDVISFLLPNLTPDVLLAKSPFNYKQSSIPECYKPLFIFHGKVSLDSLMLQNYILVDQLYYALPRY